MISAVRDRRVKHAHPPDIWFFLLVLLGARRCGLSFDAPTAGLGLSAPRPCVCVGSLRSPLHLQSSAVMIRAFVFPFRCGVVEVSSSRAPMVYVLSPCNPLIEVADAAHFMWFSMQFQHVLILNLTLGASSGRRAERSFSLFDVRACVIFTWFPSEGCLCRAAHISWALLRTKLACRKYSGH